MKLKGRVYGNVSEVSISGVNLPQMRVNRECEMSGRSVNDVGPMQMGTHGRKSISQRKSRALTLWK